MACRESYAIPCNEYKPGNPNSKGRQGIQRPFGDSSFRYRRPLADIPKLAINVRFWG